jgi:hypothetical protein
MDKVILKLEGLDGNAFNLIGTFRLAAKRQGWSQEEISAVCAEATAGNYDHLLQTLVKYTEPPTDAEAFGDESI